MSCRAARPKECNSRSGGTPAGAGEFAPAQSDCDGSFRPGARAGAGRAERVPPSKSKKPDWVHTRGGLWLYRPRVQHFTDEVSGAGWELICTGMVLRESAQNGTRAACALRPNQVFRSIPLSRLSVHRPGVLRAEARCQGNDCDVSAFNRPWPCETSTQPRCAT